MWKTDWRRERENLENEYGFTKVAKAKADHSLDLMVVIEMEKFGLTEEILRR